MTIDILVCRADGSQELESREVADDWFEVKNNAEIQTEE